MNLYFIILILGWTLEMGEIKPISYAIGGPVSIESCIRSVVVLDKVDPHNSYYCKPMEVKNAPASGYKV